MNDNEHIDHTQTFLTISWKNVLILYRGQKVYHVEYHMNSMHVHITDTGMNQLSNLFNNGISPYSYFHCPPEYQQNVWTLINSLFCINKLSSLHSFHVTAPLHSPPPPHPPMDHNC